MQNVAMTTGIYWLFNFNISKARDDFPVRIHESGFPPPPLLILSASLLPVQELYSCGNRFKRKRSLGRALNTRPGIPGTAVCLGMPRDGGTAFFSRVQAGWKEIPGEAVSLCPPFLANFVFMNLLSSFSPSLFPPFLLFFPPFLLVLLRAYSAPNKQDLIYASCLHYKINSIILPVRTLRLKEIERPNQRVSCRA